MFTGIIEAVGRLRAINSSAGGARVTIDTASLDLSDVKLGDSIATNGICLTVVTLGHDSFSADVSSETLARTGLGHYQIGDSVNLEKAMLPSTRFGGHMVSGHVDAVSAITRIEHQGNSIDYWLNMPTELAPYIAEKGSITIDGTSLTVNSLSADQFRLTIVPHTTEQTIIKNYQVGTKVNLEVDLIARYIERLLTKQSPDASVESGVTQALLARNGFIK
ncbi:riboflavin synthase alpha chain [Colwellia chukchiensis]|uniref:Riboflavin synthase n=1 Tax=Colwellia chukchiensis TaxID=641665 RepID=A0A1H7HST6_9GAMM|nr:riboflavin synthase [Colwellia chukchiensis]SEK53329.1 riboflavin synthase alpha chain [Colwellia chukchiensis]